MQTTTQETVEILNDLVQINNDRITGYEHALKELKGNDGDLVVIFQNMIDQSRQIRLELANEVQVAGATVDTGTTNSGKIYKAWMDVKALFTGHDRQTVLNNCEFGEDAAQKAYKTALAADDLPAYLRTMIQQQQAILKDSHDEIKGLRDQNKSA